MNKDLFSFLCGPRFICVPFENFWFLGIGGLDYWESSPYTQPASLIDQANNEEMIE
jgi:hypothetical protein